MAKYIVKPNQNIFDIAVHLYGTIEGVFDLLITNTWISMNTDLETGVELEYHEEFVLNESVVNKLAEDGIVPANGERSVYYKEFTEDLLAVCTISSTVPVVSLGIGGDGAVMVDWGDNSDTERIELSHTDRTITHYFDNSVESRRICFYGNTDTMKLTYLNTTELAGELVVVRPIIVDKYVNHSNDMLLSGLFLFEETFSVDLQKCTISSLLPIADMDLQELNLTDVHFTDIEVLDEYLQYIVSNYGSRRGCEVRITTEPSTIGWGHIQTILGEPEWNTPVPWKFIINGVTHTNSK